MGFLQATLDLTGTKFTQEALGGAQESLADLITRYDPLWLSKPLGPLGWYWQRSDLQSMCFLINLAETVNRLQYNVTKKSVKTLMDKFRKLLRAKSRREFEETLLELQFARALCEWVSPIAFDPFVPTMLADPGKRPRSSDFAIRLPDGDVIIEVTTLYFGALDKWTHATSLLSEQLRTLLEKRKASRAVKIVFPLEFDSITFLPRKAIVSLADEISRSESGHRPIPIRKKQGMLEWQPIPVLDAKTLMPYESVKVENTAMVGFAFAFQKYILEEDHNELFLKSLRNTLNKKQKQQLGSHPYLLTLRLGHHSMQVKGVVAATQERIWPNPKYEWLTGLLIFTPAIAFRKSDPPPTLNYSFNPNARTAPPRSLIELFAAQRRFHLRNGEYYQE